MVRSRGIRDFVDLREEVEGLVELVKQFVGQLGQRIYVFARKLLARRRRQHSDEGVAQGTRFVHEGNRLRKEAACRWDLLMAWPIHVHHKSLSNLAEAPPKRITERLVEIVYHRPPFGDD